MDLEYEPTSEPLYTSCKVDVLKLGAKPGCQVRNRDAARDTAIPNYIPNEV